MSSIVNMKKKIWSPIVNKLPFLRCYFKTSLH
jgi:hypothetical protein